ncbi:MAG TPA: 4-alpha-glucanotransferase [Kofleriaceae bacterium]|jgi:4-alpha-glucanotransferase
MTLDALHGLARVAGIDPAYSSWRGEPTVSSEPALRAALRALLPDLGLAPDADRDPHAAIAAIERQRWQETVPPVVLGWDGLVEVPFSVRADFDADWELEIRTEGGERHVWTGRLFDLTADSHGYPDGVISCVRRVRVEVGELGYHALAWRVAGAIGESLVICAPTRAHGAPGSGARRWGVFAPVYGLAGHQSGDAGDLGTLARLIAAVAGRGGSYVATLPLLAAFLGANGEPCQFSPYAPASRLFWNELYLDLAVLAQEVGMPAPTVPVMEPGPFVDYESQYRWRRHALDPICQRLAVTRGNEIEQWAAAETHFGVYDYAAFRALGEQAKRSWQGWAHHGLTPPPPVADRQHAIALGADSSRVTTHVVAQWAMQRQLAQLGTIADGHARLYLDLPVGVSCDAYEVWRHRSLFLTSLAAGAPPDALFLGGQDWGLPPLAPNALRRDGYRYVRRCVQHHMRVSGMLRIDHVMGLFRLYCVPSGFAATDGVYLRYPADELLAVLTLESSRAHCALVGEDLGTVPDHVRPAMAKHGLYRLHVGQWSLPAHVGEAPGPAPAPSVASLNTHDTATFAGWWRGADIDDVRDLGLISAADAELQHGARLDARAALLAFAAEHAYPAADGLDDAARAMVAATADLATSDAEVVLVSLDDLTLEALPHNVPGTTSAQRPNWQRRVPAWDTVLSPDAPPEAAAALAAVVAARPR